MTKYRNQVVVYRVIQGHNRKTLTKTLSPNKQDLYLKKNQKLICGLDIHCYTTVLPNFDHFVLILLKTGIFNRTFNPADYTSEARTGSTQTDGWDTVANSNTDGTGERWRVHFLFTCITETLLCSSINVSLQHCIGILSMADIDSHIGLCYYFWCFH